MTDKNDENRFLTAEELRECRKRLGDDYGDKDMEATAYCKAQLTKDLKFEQRALAEARRQERLRVFRKIEERATWHNGILHYSPNAWQALKQEEQDGMAVPEVQLSKNR